MRETQKIISISESVFYKLSACFQFTLFICHLCFFKKNFCGNEIFLLRRKKSVKYEEFFISFSILATFLYKPSLFPTDFWKNPFRSFLLRWFLVFFFFKGLFPKSYLFSRKLQVTWRMTRQILHVYHETNGQNDSYFSIWINFPIKKSSILNGKAYITIWKVCREFL